MKTIKCGGSREIIESLSHEIENAKAIDAFAPIAVLAPSYHIADRAIRRQISQSHKTLVNVQAATPIEILRQLCSRLEFAWNPEDVAYLNAECIRIALSRTTGEWALVNPDIDANIDALSRLSKKFAWINLADLSYETALEKLPHLTEITRGAIPLMRAVQDELGKRGATLPAGALLHLKNLDRDIVTRIVAQSFPTVVAIGSSVPLALLGFLSEMGSNIVRLELSPEAIPAPINVSSAPDPETECALALGFVGDSIREGIQPTSIAIAYTDEAEYLPVLERALADSNIHWFGKTTDNSMATKPSQMFMLMLAVLERYQKGQAVTREQLLQLFALGRVPVTLKNRVGEETSRPLEREMAKYLVDNSLFGDSANWCSKLDVSETEYFRLAEEFQQSKDDDEDINASLRQQFRQATAAFGLQQLLSKLDRLFGAVELKSNVDITATCLNAIPEVIWVREWLYKAGDSSSDARNVGAYSAVKAFESRVPSGDGPDFDSIRSLYIAEMGRNTVQNGKYHAGIVVGPLSEIAYSDWSAVAVVGCDEAAISDTLSESPIITNAVIDLLAELSQGLLEPTEIARKKSRIEMAALTGATGKRHFSYSRGGNLRNRENKPIALSHESKTDSMEASSFDSYWQFIDVDKSPYLGGTRSIKHASQIKSMKDAEEIRQFQSARAFREPLQTNYFGFLAEPSRHDGNALLRDKVLSASYVESFLDCPNHFFVTKILGISDDAAELEIDEVKASDFGLAIHNAFQHLVDPTAETYPTELPGCSHTDLQELIPGVGERFGKEAQDHLLELFNYESEKLVENSMSGWGPRFREKNRIFTRSANLFLALDYTARNFEIEWNQKIGADGQYKSNRSTYQCEPLPVTDKMLPRYAEWEFGYGDENSDVLVVPVTLQDGSLVSVRFRGRIDRVDLNLDETRATVIDYKSSKASSLIDKADRKIQDLVYSLAVWNSPEFTRVQSVPSLYLALNESSAETGVVRLGNRDEFGAEPRSRQRSEEILREVLKDFAGSLIAGKFPPLQVTKSEAGTYCPTCLKIGVRTAHKATVLPAVETDGDIATNESSEHDD